jgi:hypothetical protein
MLIHVKEITNAYTEEHDSSPMGHSSPPTCKPFRNHLSTQLTPEAAWKLPTTFKSLEQVTSGTPTLLLGTQEESLIPTEQTETVIAWDLAGDQEIDLFPQATLTVDWYSRMFGPMAQTA